MLALLIILAVLPGFIFSNINLMWNRFSIIFKRMSYASSTLEFVLFSLTGVASIIVFTATSSELAFPIECLVHTPHSKTGLLNINIIT